MSAKSEDNLDDANAEAAAVAAENEAGWAAWAEQTAEQINGTTE